MQTTTWLLLLPLLTERTELGIGCKRMLLDVKLRARSFPEIRTLSIIYSPRRTAPTKGAQPDLLKRSTIELKR